MSRVKAQKRKLEERQAWWNKLPNNVQNATTKPGSEKK